MIRAAHNTMAAANALQSSLRPAAPAAAVASASLLRGLARRALHCHSSLRSDDASSSSSGSSSSSSSDPSLFGGFHPQTSGAILRSRAHSAAAGPVHDIEKQKVHMYQKVLRVIRSPTKGDVPDTQGDDYLLDQTESESMQADFPGLITANLSGPGRKNDGRRKGLSGGRAFGQGGRKAAVAKVWIQSALTKGTGEFYVNGVRYVDYFPELEHRWAVCAPFFYTGTLMDFDMIAVVRGGGHSGQSGAIKHAAAKALQNYNRKKYRPILKKKFLLSRDARVVERQKYGQFGARKKYTFVKR